MMNVMILLAASSLTFRSNDSPVPVSFTVISSDLLGIMSPYPPYNPQ